MKQEEELASSLMGHSAGSINSPTGKTSGEKDMSKSLFFCLTLESPLDWRSADANGTRKGGGEDPSVFHFIPDAGLPPTLIHDELLCTDPLDPAAGGDDTASAMAKVRELGLNPNDPFQVPNRFQKIIEIVLRLRERHVDIIPSDMIGQTESPESVPAEDGGPANFLADCCCCRCRESDGVLRGAAWTNSPCRRQKGGFYLRRNACYLSPDCDEVNLKIHMPSCTLLDFAELAGLQLATHMYSFAGGAPMTFTRETNKALKESVVQYYTMLRAMDTEGARAAAAGEFHALSSSIAVSPELQARIDDAFGFRIGVPEKQRIFNRFIREPYRFGGCGIQVNEMRSKGVLVKHFFPLHNNVQLEKKGLMEWAKLSSWRQAQPMRAILNYFGEELAIYFYWLEWYTRVMLLLAVLGLTASIVGWVSESRKHITFGIFAICCLMWAVIWNGSWPRLQRLFFTEHHLHAVMQQEVIRDLFSGTERVVDDEDLHTLDFEYPAVLRETHNGLVEVYYPSWKRTLFRAFSYVAILSLTCIMAGLLSVLTYARFDNSESIGIQYLISIGSAVVTIFFDFAFQVVIDKTTALENNPTDKVQEFQYTVKRFFYHFVSKYFALISLLLWPNDKMSSSERLGALESQLIIASIASPFFQNFTETLGPIMKMNFRINYDNLESYPKAIIATLQFKSFKDYPLRTINEEANQLWVEAQREPMDSIGDDYLEILIKFGFMVMFAVIFPLSSVASFLFNIAEVRVDAYKFVHFHQRPFAKPATDIGAWKWMFILLTVIAVVTNSYAVSLYSAVVTDIGLDSDPAARYRFYLYFQYVLCIGAFFALPIPSFFIRDDFRKTQVKHRVLFTRRMRMVNNNQQSGGGDGHSANQQRSRGPSSQPTLGAAAAPPTMMAVENQQSTMLSSIQSNAYTRKDSLPPLGEADDFGSISDPDPEGIFSGV